MEQKRIDVKATPLVVDLDGSLFRTDTLHELVAASLTKPTVLAAAIWQLARHGKAALKRRLASQTALNVELLPVNSAVVEFIRSQFADGRIVFLATGADSTIAEQVTEYFPELQGSFASDGTVNLTGERKAALLVEQFGANGFDYIGDSRKDLAVWRQADHAYLATSRRSSRLPSWARNASLADVLREDSPSMWRSWLREVRIHQSLKNLLLFLPLLAAHAFGDLNLVLLLVAGCIAFTFMASSVYLLNDLLDLRSDRLHPGKSSRPLAAGRIPAIQALLVSIVLAVVALVAAFVIDFRFALVLTLYAVLTCLYSFWLKRVTLVDVVVLAMLYMIRILAGAVLAHVALSFWFTSVALFLFISLALVKRYTELSRQVPADVNDRLPGRGYSNADRVVVLPLGIGAGMAVLLLLAIYLQTDAVAVLYPSAAILWLVIPATFYWIANIWLQAGRGAIHDDPIVFALKNPASLVSAGMIALLFIAASTPVMAIVSQISLAVR